MIYMHNDIKDHRNNNLIKNHASDMGYDIRSGESVVIPPGGHAVIETGLHVYMPHYLGAIIKSRSGLAVKYSVECSNAGVIDAGYTGTLKVKLYNFDQNEPYKVQVGDRIAQLVFHIRPEGFWGFLAEMFYKAYIPDFTIEERLLSEWPKSDRGNNGFGSSGR